MFEDRFDASRSRISRPGTAKSRSIPSRSEAVGSRPTSHYITRNDAVRHSDGKQIIQEAKRTMNFASIASHSMIDQFLNRMKTYRTFQPLFATNKLYTSRKVSDSEDSEGGNINSWAIIDHLIDTSTNHLLRNRADEHFFASFTRVRGESFRPAQRNRLHKVGFARREDLVDFEKGSLEKKNPAFMDTWKREHPLQTEEEKEGESTFWESAFYVSDVASRKAYLKELHEEIESLVKLCSTFEESNSKKENQLAEKTIDTPQGLPSYHDYESQQLSWTMFCKGEGCTPGFTIQKTAPCIVSEYKDTEEIHKWIHRNWPHHTHRHENAALTIQKAYRSFRAKYETERKRYARLHMLREIKLLEDEVKKKWFTSLRDDWLQQATTNDNTPESRAIRFVSRKLVAVIKKRRAAIEKINRQTRETQIYAATLIQKTFRGYMIRNRFYLYPEIREKRLQEKQNVAAYRIQGTWKRMLALRNMERIRNAAVSIQCCYRSYVARELHRQLRGQKRVKLEDDRKVCAAQILTSLGVRKMYQKYLLFKTNGEHITLLQRVGRGYIGRHLAFNIPLQRKKEEAALVISTRWNYILQRRRAKFYCSTFEKHKERENWNQIRSDACKTIQLAWRNHRDYEAYKRNAVMNKTVVGTEVRGFQNVEHGPNGAMADG